MANFKAGDLALIVGHKTVPENIGKVVELIEIVQPMSSTKSFAPNGYPATNDSDVPLWFVIADGLIPNPLSSATGFAGAEERNLMPLRGNEQPAQQRKQEQLA